MPFPAHDEYLLKLTNSGIIQWNKVFTGIINGQHGGCEYETGPIVSNDGNGIYYLTNCVNGTGGGGYSLTTVKYNSAGDSQWVHSYSGGVPANLKISPAA